MEKLRLCLISILMIFPTLGKSKNICEKHKIYCKILTVKPSINKKFAMELSNHLYKYTKIYKTDANISVAIAMQESSLRNINKMASVHHGGKVVKGVTDVGVFQFHVDTINNFNLDYDNSSNSYH